jgi:transcriptional regulator with XRE-family HTH domain
MSPEEVHAVVAAQIRERVAARGISLRTLAERADTSRSHLAAVLDGTRSPTVTWLCRIAAVLDCQPYDLMRPPRARPAGKP